MKHRPAALSFIGALARSTAFEVAGGHDLAGDNPAGLTKAIGDYLSKAAL